MDLLIIVRNTIVMKDLSRKKSQNMKLVCPNDSSRYWNGAYVIRNTETGATAEVVFLQRLSEKTQELM